MVDKVDKGLIFAAPEKMHGHPSAKYNGAEGDGHP
jgi:hypothetical protein